MALIKCLEHECKKIVSDKAEYCPECGYPIASKQSRKKQTEFIKDNSGIIKILRERKIKEDEQMKLLKEKETAQKREENAKVRRWEQLEKFKRVQRELELEYLLMNGGGSKSASVTKCDSCQLRYGPYNFTPDKPVSENSDNSENSKGYIGEDCFKREVVATKFATYYVCSRN